MTDGPENKNVQQLENAYQTLKRVSTNIDYEVLSFEPGPLPLDQIPLKARESEAMQQTFARVGWPSLTDDVPIERPRVFMTNIEFLNALRPVDEDGHRFIASSNFYQLLQQSPKSPDDMLMSPGENIYALQGRLPALLRANAAFPELFDSLRVALRDFSKKNDYMDIDDNDPIFAALLTEKNKPLLTSMRIAYQLMVRLTKQSDHTEYRRVLEEQGIHFGDNAISDPFVDPEKMLLYGNSNPLE